MSENWDIQKPEGLDNKDLDKLDDNRITVAHIIGTDDEDKFLEFDLTEIQNLVSNLQSIGVDDLGHAMHLQQQALRCADILSEYLGKIVKTISYLDAKLSSKKNSVALNYSPPNGTRPSIELRKMAGESDEEVEKLSLKLAKAKGTKSVLEKKYDIVVKSHHHYKDIATGLRRTI
jgi:hypothetical protein